MGSAQVLRPWLEALPAGATALYVGDGKGDFGAAVQLRPQDVLCVRRGFAMHKIVKRQPAEAVRARMVEWADGAELAVAIAQAAEGTKL